MAADTELAGISTLDPLDTVCSRLCRRLVFRFHFDRKPNRQPIQWNTSGQDRGKINRAATTGRGTIAASLVDSRAAR